MLNIESIWSSHFDPRHLPRRNEKQIHRETCTWIFTPTLFISQKVKQLNVQLINNKMCSIHTTDYYSAISMKWGTETCYNREEAWKHDAQWTEPDTHSHTLCNPLYMKCPESASPKTQKVDWWLPGSRERGRSAHGCEVSLWSDGNVLKLGNTESCVILCNVLKINELYTSKW